MTHQNLLAGQDTRLPEDPAAAELGDPERFPQILRTHPESSLCWAILAEGALASDTQDGDIAAYAYARTGYHRGLDALRRAGWRGSGPVPWEHEPNQGFLRALAALARAATRFGEEAEIERCTQFLRDCSETAWRELLEKPELENSQDEPADARADAQPAASHDPTRQVPEQPHASGPDEDAEDADHPQQQRQAVIDVVPPAQRPAEPVPGAELQSAAEQ